MYIRNVYCGHMSLRIYAGQSATARVCGSDAVTLASSGLRTQVLEGPGGNCAQCIVLSAASVDAIARDYSVSATGPCPFDPGSDVAVADALPPGTVGCIENCTVDHIAGGQVASPLDFMVSLQQPAGSHVCGGTLVAKGIVLTAAHCAVDFSGNGQAVSALVGALDYASGAGVAMPPRAGRYAASSWLPHPAYNGVTWAHDVAILRLGALTAGVDVTREYAVGPWSTTGGALPLGIPLNAQLAILGWGITTTSGAPARLLRNATVPFVPLAACRADAVAAHIDNPLTADTVCAGVPLVIDTCAGDSGGPLLLLGGSQATSVGQQVGVTSHGAFACGGAGDNIPGAYAGVYDNVTSAWLVSQIGTSNAQSRNSSGLTIAPSAATGESSSQSFVVALPGILVALHLVSMLFAWQRRPT